MAKIPRHAEEVREILFGYRRASEISGGVVVEHYGNKIRLDGNVALLAKSFVDALRHYALAFYIEQIEIWGRMEGGGQVGRG